MAVAPMLRVTVLGHAHAIDDVIGAIQRAGALEIEAREFDNEAIEHVSIHPDDERLRLLDERIADAQFIRDYLSRFHAPSHVFATFIAEKIHVEHGEFLTLEFDASFHRVYRESVTLADLVASRERERERLEALIADLAPWREFRLPIAQWKGTDSTHLFTGTVPAAQCASIRQRLREAIQDVTVEELGPIDDRQAWVVIATNDRVEDAKAILLSTEFVEVAFPDLTDYPAEEIANAQERLDEIAVEIERARERSTVLAAAHYGEAVAIVQALESQRDALLVRDQFAHTESAFAATGWLPASRQAELEAAIAPYGDSIDLTLEEPTREDAPPVALENRRWVRPFEILTDLYGRPDYWDADPTPVLAPFFLLFFAICIGDVGYGLMLVIGAWLIKHKLDIAPGVKKFMDLLILGGFGSMLIGVALGGYFAIPVEYLPQVLQNAQMLDPIEDVQTFLLVALVLGIIQVFFGILLAAWHSIRRGDALSAISDHLSIVFLFLMLAGSFAAGFAGNATLLRASLVLGIVGTMLLQGRAVQAALRAEDVASWDRWLGVGWIAVFVGGLFAYAFTGAVAALWAMGGVCLLAVVSRSARAAVVAVLLGAYNVYGLTGVVGDVLSYLRLAALGLSSTLVGWVFNILTELVWTSAAPMFAAGGLAWVFAGLIALAAVLIFSVGHVFNVVINLLGAFVHPARLQFVEFFSKFYEAGGRPFAPFRFKTEGLVLEAGAAGEERGKVS